MKELKTQSHVLHFMLGTLRLSRQDAKFLHNLSMLLHNKQNVTSNQVNLYKKILSKYERQFNKHNYNVTLLFSLPWNINIIQSSYEYTNAFINIVDGKIILKCPYNQKFISTLRGLNGNEAFVWNKSQKQYEASYSTYNLKIIVDAAFLHFENASCCPIVVKLLDQLYLLDDAKYWNPTLEKINNNYIIVAANEHVLSAIENIELNDDPHTLNKLSYYGIEISDSIKNKSKLHRFAGEFETRVEITDTKFIVDCIKQVKADIVFIGSGDLNSQKAKNEIVTMLVDTGIEVKTINLFNNWGDADIIDPRKYQNPIYLRFKKTQLMEVTPVNKIVTLVNSTPINIK